MTKKEVINELELKYAAEHEEYKKQYDSYHSGAMAAIDEAIQIVEKLDDTEQKWIPVSERLPENEQEVEVTYVKYHWETGETLYYTCRALYTDGTMNTDDSSYVWNETDNWEYNENLDAYIIPEGWWGAVSFAEESCCIDRPVIAWQPLPEPYKAGEHHD